MQTAYAARLLACEAPAANAEFSGITTDSRQVRPGMLFAALSGQTHDGHDYVDMALEKGAAAVMASRPLTTPLPLLLVDDVVRALGVLAADWRRQCGSLVVGITGSNGKTTVKEMVASVLGQKAGVLATKGNFNNELGLPLTLFQLEPSHAYAVLEMGASNPGDIAYLAAIAQPQVGVITNIGPAHLQGFINEEGVARAKGELYAALPPDGTAVINAAEPWVELWLGMNRAGSTVFFNTDDGSGISLGGTAQRPVIRTPAAEFSLRLSLPGRHNLSNAMAATAACLALGTEPEAIKTGLELVKPVPGRLNLVPAQAGWTVIDDTYNANPASLYAALQVLAAQHGEPWLVLGDMAELGSNSRKMHAELGDAARSLGVKRLFAVGSASTATVDAFGEKASHYESREALIEALRSELRPGVACLVKGSRSMGMENVVSAISDQKAYAGGGN
ncbi:MAG: UDP-N-acetylmuramoyl-tripeptide--D-alanyl-D-alanine ligase [Lysobacterales bacterium]|jgi:UDP-N-acetylmuramoyl-tripeptide--D-alanyl-D-alanine ligase